MPGTFSPSTRLSDPDMHHGTCVTHVPWCMPGSLTSGFLWSRWRGKRSRHSLCMHNRYIYVSGKRPMYQDICLWEFDLAIRVRVIKPFSPFRYFPTFSALSNHTLDIEYHVNIWQVSPRLSCGDTCHIRMWLRESKRYRCKIKGFAYGEINERSFINPYPWCWNRNSWMIMQMPSPVRQQQWHWICRLNISSSSSTTDFFDKGLLSPGPSECWRISNKFQCFCI